MINTSGEFWHFPLKKRMATSCRCIFASRSFPNSKSKNPHGKSWQVTLVSYHLFSKYHLASSCTKKKSLKKFRYLYPSMSIPTFGVGCQQLMYNRQDIGQGFASASLRQDEGWDTYGTVKDGAIKLPSRKRIHIHISHRSRQVRNFHGLESDGDWKGYVIVPWRLPS